MAENPTDVIWLTQDASDKLTEELEYLKGDGRTEVSEKIARARDAEAELRLLAWANMAWWSPDRGRYRRAMTARRRR